MVRTRMAPSPTGNLHLGTAYATLWPYLFAKKNNGKFILRIEDTDKERSTDEFARNIIEGLKWLNLNWDEGPYYQMQRLNLYEKYTQELLSADRAYYCFCTKEELEKIRKKQIQEKKAQVYSGKCRILSKEQAEEKKKILPFVVRFKLAESRGVVEFEDLIHGKISFDSKIIGDSVIMRQNGVPLYNFAVVVDDIDMGITHVIRGDDHISNTPKQILIFEALNKTPPQYGHYPVILNQDRSGKLSKRTGTATALLDYRHEGYLPEAMVNYLALLGWTPPDDKEILSIEEITELFDIKDINKAPAAWNHEKLDWLNGEYIRKLSDEELTKRFHEYLVDHPAKEKIAPLVPLIKERIKKLSDFIPLTNFIFNEPEYDKNFFEKLNLNNTKEVLQKVLEKMQQIETPWESQNFEQTFRNLAEELNLPAGGVFQLIRVSVSGQAVTPPLFESIKIVGEDKTLARIKNVVDNILVDDKK